MRRLFVILGLVVAIIAIILSVTPFSKISYIPAILALVLGLVAFYHSRQKQYPQKSIQLIFLLTIIALSITTYKAVFDVVQVGNVEGLELKEKESEQKALDELNDIEIDESDLQMDDNQELDNFE